MPAVTVFLSSSPKVEKRFLDLAAETGSELARRGFEVVFGGTAAGCMLALASAARKSGGRVTGIIPASMADKGMAFSGCTELLVLKNLSERKALLKSRADMILVLPGGAGTLDELMDVTAARLCGEYDRPVMILNAFGFYEALLEQFQRFFDTGFMNVRPEELFGNVDSLEQLFLTPFFKNAKFEL